MFISCVGFILPNVEFISMLWFANLILKTEKILQKVAKGGREMRQKNISMGMHTL